MTTRGVCVGINKFKNFPDDTLQMCVNDARSMESVFLGLGVADQNMTYLLDSAATKANIYAALQQAVRYSIPGDVLLWSQSGHGTTVKDKHGTTHEALVCYDTALKEGGDWNLDTLLLGPEVGAVLKQMPKKSQVEMWWDACFSGLGLRALLIGNKVKFRAKYLIPPNQESNIILTPDRMLVDDIPVEIVLWAACSGNQTAADVPALGNGAFTYYWLKNYQQTKRRVDLIALTRKGLRLAGFQQNPHLECNARDAKEMVGQ